MNKLRKRLSKWFLDTAKKLDSNTVNDNSAIIQHITMYDHYHAYKIRAQYQISNTMLDTYRRMEGYDNFIEERIPEILTREIAEEIMKTYKSEIKKTQLASMDNLLYSLDVYVCKPQKKRVYYRLSFILNDILNVHTSSGQSFVKSITIASSRFENNSLNQFE